MTEASGPVYKSPTQRLQAGAKKMPKWTTVALLVGGVALATLGILTRIGTLHLPFMHHLGLSAKNAQDGAMILGGVLALTGAGLSISKIISWATEKIAQKKEKKTAQEASVIVEFEEELPEVTLKDRKPYLGEDKITITLKEDNSTLLQTINKEMTTEWVGALKLMENHPEIESLQIGNTVYKRWKGHIVLEKPQEEGK